MEKQEKFALILGLITIVVMGLFLGKEMPQPKAQVEYAVANDGGTLPLIHAHVVAVRHPDYIEVEYEGNSYSTSIDTDSEICTGDEIWVTFALYEGELELIDIK